MGKPAARLTDMHVCPFQTPAVVPIPHVGGPIIGPGAPTVFIGGMPAAVMGDMCTCVGPPAPIVLGSMGVMIGGKPAARMGDMTGHGGSIVAGCPTVLIGEIGSGGGGGGGAGGGAGAGGNMSAITAAANLNKTALIDAANNGDGLAPKSTTDDMKAQFTLVDEANKAVAHTDYRIQTSDGQIHTGTTDGSGKTSMLNGYMPGDCRVSFLNQ